MGYIRECDKGEFYYYVYEMKNYSLIEAIHWIKSLFDRQVVTAKMITLRDSYRNMDEGNKSTQFKIPFDEKIVEKEIVKREIDKISIDGNMGSTSIALSYNLKNNIVSIGFDSDSKIDRNIVEKKLSLS